MSEQLQPLGHSGTIISEHRCEPPREVTINGQFAGKVFYIRKLVNRTIVYVDRSHMSDLIPIPKMAVNVCPIEWLDQAKELTDGQSS